MRALRSSLGLLFAAIALAQAPPEPASVAGRVTHALTGAPILRAHIALRGSGPGAKTYGAMTDAEGRFSITGIVPGRYLASADRIGFFVPATASGRTVIDLTVGAGDKKEDVRFRLAPSGSISGRVLDTEGEPVESATVTVETGPFGSNAGMDTTDDKGRFRLPGLPPGRYRVKAATSQSIYVTVPTSPEIRTDGTVEARYLPTYFGGATEYKSAARVEVTTGADVSGIEIRLMRGPMMRITGKVAGVPPDMRGTLLFSRTMMGSRGLGGLKKDGTFELWNVDPGQYLLSAAWMSGGKRVQTAPIDIEVGLSHIENLELRVIPPFDISGRIVFEDEQARPQPASPNQKEPQAQQGRPGNPGPARVELRTVDPISADPLRSDIAEDGSFHFAGVQAVRYRVMLSWPSAYVKAVTLGSNQADGNVLNVRNGAGGAAVSVLVSSAFGSISGKVADGDAPVAGARVALVRDDFVSLGDFTSVETDGSGVYTFNNVRPGKYRIAALEGDDNAARFGNLDDYEDILARIDVQPKDKLSIDLKRHPPVK